MLNLHLDLTYDSKSNFSTFFVRVSPLLWN